MAHSMIEESVPGMIDRAVARSLRDATKEAGGLIHKEVTSLKVEINQIRQGGQAAQKACSLGASMCCFGTSSQWPPQQQPVCQVGYLRCRANFPGILSGTSRAVR